MKVWQFIRPDIAVAALAHILILGLIILFSEVQPFGSAASEPIAVDLVTPDEVKAASEPAPTPTPQPTSSPDLSQLSKPETAAEAPSPRAAEPPSQQAAVQSNPQPAAPQPQPQPQPQPSPAAAAVAPQPLPGLGFTPAQPDITIKYNVMLGLPQALPTSKADSGDKGSDGFDATASSDANISSSVITEFRQHLKSCSKLPASIAPSDRLVVKLRVQMTMDGKLAADPMVAGGSANPKALDLLRGAVDALKACQPYTMLPANRYGEWKVLDLDFTPRDFSS
jgi:outer membrane biosynthesis protein TonB